MTLSSAAHAWAHMGMVPPALTLVVDTLTGLCNHLLSSRMVVLLGDCQAAAVNRAEDLGFWRLDLQDLEFWRLGAAAPLHR